MKRKIILWAVALISLVLWIFPLSGHKTEKESPALTTVKNAKLTPGDLLYIKNGKTVISDIDKQSGINPVIKTLNAGVPLKPISRRAVYEFKVELETGEVGYLNLFDIDELRNMVSVQPVAVFKDEKLRQVADTLQPGTEGRLIDVRNNLGTWVLKLKDGRQVFVASRTGLGWADTLAIDRLPMEDQSSTRGVSLTKNRLESEFMGKDYQEFKKHLPLPDAYVLCAGDSSKAYYNHISVFVNNRLKQGMTVTFQNGMAHSYSLGAKERGKFFGGFPLAGFVAGFKWPAAVSGLFKYRHETWLDRLSNGAWYAYVASLLVSLVLLILVFSVPYFIIYPFYYLFMRIKKLGNTMVTVLCLVPLCVIFYLWFLTFFIHFDSRQPLFYFIICLGLSIWYTTFTKGRIAYHRCPNCHTVYSASHEGTDYLGAQTTVNKVTQDVYKGTTETADTITHHYERQTHNEYKTVQFFADKRKCHNCGYCWSVRRKVTY
jgi:hypothetical protein